MTQKVVSGPRPRPHSTVEHFRAAAHAWFADGRLISESLGMALGESSFPLPSAADQQRIYEWIARRHGLTGEEVAALGKLLERKPRARRRPKKVANDRRKDR